ncbi:MAG: hypothetical protein OXE76_03950 [Alphaproteobacteria bacterium]|nr:hypothetical protein [Alphaproteobacteria bacterium]
MTTLDDLARAAQAARRLFGRDHGRLDRVLIALIRDAWVCTVDPEPWYRVSEAMEGRELERHRLARGQR